MFFKFHPHKKKKKDKYSEEIKKNTLLKKIGGMNKTFCIVKNKPSMLDKN